MSKSHTFIRWVAAGLAMSLMVSACGDDDDGQESTGPEDDGRECIDDFDPDQDYFADKVTADHSEHWSASYHDSYVVLSVKNTEFEDRDDLKYVLVRCGAPEPDLDGELAGAQVFDVPVQRTVLNHRNALAMLEEVDGLETIVGLADSLISMAEEEEWAAERVDRAAETTNVGGEGGDGVDYETTLGIEPDVILLHGYGAGYTNVADTVDRGLPAVMVSNLLEPSPLGAAEWIKFLAPFYGSEAKANETFNEIEARYSAVTDKVAAEVDGQLSSAFLCFDPDRGCEFMYAHGDDSMNGQVLSSLGVDNVFAEGNPGGNGMNFDYEDSLDRAADAEFLVVYERQDSIDRLMAADERYSNFEALAEGNYISFISDKFSQCRATTYVYVDRLVQDFAAGIWPELFEDWEPDCFAPPAR